MIFNLAEISHTFMLGASAVAFLYIPGILITLFLWKSMLWTERIAISPFFIIAGIIFIVKLLKALGIELISIPQIYILSGMNIVTLVCALKIVRCSRKEV